MESRWITVDASVMNGRPVIAGTRITVESILDRLAADESVEEITRGEPKLTAEAVQAALDFAAATYRAEAACPLPGGYW